MKALKPTVITGLVLFSFLSSITTQVDAKRASGESGASHHVNGHFKKDGTYVQPHHATNPNHTQRDNYSSKPNVNPYNGKQGTKEPQH